MNMKKYINKFVTFCKEEEGASAIEYVVICSIVAVVILTFGTGLGDRIVELLTEIQQGL